MLASSKGNRAGATSGAPESMSEILSASGSPKMGAPNAEASTTRTFISLCVSFSMTQKVSEDQNCEPLQAIPQDLAVVHLSRFFQELP
jgi:hypothetical protein